MLDFQILITNPIKLVLPGSFTGWILWFVFLGLIIYFNRRWQGMNQSLTSWRTRALLLILLSVPLTTLLLPSVQLGDLSPNLSIPIFSALPWFLAAGFLGPAFASIIGFLTGLLISIWGNSNFFLPLELAFLAAWLSWMFYQEYRTPL